MAFIIEDGTGVASANAYASVAFVAAYLTERNRITEGGWQTSAATVQQAAIVAATDYVETRWGLRFKGSRLFRDVSVARATLTLTGLPTDTETVTIGSVVYTFNTVLGGANSVLIGVSVDASISNLVNAVQANAAEAGVTHGAGTVENPDATAAETLGDTMLATAKEKGTAGNDVATATTVAAGTWSSTTLAGGGDVQVRQALSFPRLHLFDRDGIIVVGIPDRLMFATAEYAVRSLVAALAPDPTVDVTGKAVIEKREKLGPIETETRYEEGSLVSQAIRPYPAADRLLTEYVTSGGRVIRG